MKNSGIEWTDHTKNIVWGCIYDGPDCTGCYAEGQATRFDYNVWGPAATTGRRVMTDKYWAEYDILNKAAEKAQTPAAVFVGSMCDWAENHPTTREQVKRLFPIIERTPWLTYLMLTKRPQNIVDVVPAAWLEDWPMNAWLGTSAGYQEAAERRIPALTSINVSAVKFLSLEPLIGEIDLRWLAYEEAGPDWSSVNNLVDWVIAGGESGPRARPMHPDWARRLRDQCQFAGIPFFFKQWGQYVPVGQTDREWYNSGEWLLCDDGNTSVQAIHLKSKHDAGRKLDGREWNERPALHNPNL